MSTQLPVKWHGGHMLVEPFPGAGVWALLDTGAGHTASHRKGDGYLGSTLSDIEALAGTRIDLLVGLDAFRSQPVLLTREFVEFGAARPDGALIPARRGSTVMQLSVSREGMADTECWGFFDSGAEFSYIDPSLIEPSSCCGIVEDFFPPIGKYQAMQFVSRARLGTSSVTLRPIVPIATKVGVTSAQRQLLIGSELIRQGDLWIDLSSDHFIWRARNDSPDDPLRSRERPEDGRGVRAWPDWGRNAAEASPDLQYGWPDRADSRGLREALEWDHHG